MPDEPSNDERAVEPAVAPDGARREREASRVNPRRLPLDPKSEMTQYYTTVIPIHNAALSLTSRLSLQVAYGSSRCQAGWTDSRCSRG